MKTNKKANAPRTAGGKGALAARQTPEALLRRSVMSCMLWEDLAYAKGSEVADNIRQLVRAVDLETASQIALDARLKQKIRHAPLLVVREMARHPSLGWAKATWGRDDANAPHLVSDTLYQVIQRADELAEFLSIYWKDGRQPLSAQVKKGLAMAFDKFNEYHFAKYDRDGIVKLRDALFLSHAAKNKVKGYTKEARKQGVQPPNAEAELYKRIIERKLETPDTWEVALSAGENKRDTFERLIKTGKLGAQAFLRNLRGMTDAGVDPDIIREGLRNLSPRWLVPLNYLAAARYAPQFEPEIEDLMLRGFQTVAKLPGHTVFIVDVSGSMTQSISDKSQFRRMEVAAAMAMTAEATCESVSIYATAGRDGWNDGNHKTKLIAQHGGILRGSGFRLSDELTSSGLYEELGGGGIFTRQALDYCKEQEGNRRVDRVVVFSDSQDMDRSSKEPEPFGFANYIVDVSAHKHGVNYDGVWTAEISGWSDHFIDYIASMEGQDWTQEGDTEIAGLLQPGE